ncbi:hypothetical protein NFI96_006434 [Prochilodus magdalenae]|nr:hypothetical protein NFI96_006434 [Prochilodus magdalenae]
MKIQLRPQYNLKQLKNLAGGGITQLAISEDTPAVITEKKKRTKETEGENRRRWRTRRFRELKVLRGKKFLKKKLGNSKVQPVEEETSTSREMEHQEFQSAPSDQSRRGQKFLNSVKRTGAKLSQKVRNRLQEHQKRSAVHPSNNSPSTSTELQHREFQSAPTGQHKRGKKFLKKLKKIQERFSNNRIRPVEEKQGTSGVDGVNTEEPETTSISGFNKIEHLTKKKKKKRVHFEPTPPTSTEMESENTKDAPCDQQEERAENTCSETVQIIRAKVIQTSLRLLEEQDRRASVATVIMEEPESTTVVMDDSLWARVKSKVSKFPSIKEYAHRILENCFFSGFVTLMIVLSFLVVIVQSEISDRPHLAVASQVCSMLNWLIVATFYLEILLKMIVGFRQFWRNMWNIFDLIVTSLSVLPETVTAFSGTGTQSLKIVKLIRTFRVLRALKITAKFRELRVTVLAVTKACK